jgi:hypothetical protein
MKKKIMFLLLSALVLLLTSCPPAIDQMAIDEMLDLTPPSLKVTYPLDSTEYEQNVVVSGIALDGGGQIRHINYDVSGPLGSLLSGSIFGDRLDGGGHFSFNFSTVSFDGPIVITVEAEDWNDNKIQTQINLLDPGSAISSLTAIPDNKSIELTWDSVEGALDYTVFYTTNGTLPSESYGNNITLTETSHIFTNLKNGNSHIFLLRANLPDGSFWSSYVTAIPLSPLTLAPLVTPGYGEIKLEWDEIGATNQFQILRSQNLSGPYTDYSGLIQGNEYIDEGVSAGNWYYYKVRPNMAGSIVSQANGAQTFQLPETPEDAISHLTLSSSAEKVKFPPWGGDYAYVAAGSGGLLVVDISSPDSPFVASTLATTNALDVALYDHGSGVHYAYIADGTGKVRAVNVSNPLNPLLTGTYTGTLGNATVVVADTGYDNLLVIDSSGNSKVMAFDISGQSIMTLKNSLDGNGSMHFADLALSHYSAGFFFLYLTSTEEDSLYEYYMNRSSGSFTFWDDYTDPGHKANYVETSGNYVYVLGRATAYLEPPPPYAVMALSKYPASLTKVGESGGSNGYISDMTIVGDKIYLADGIGVQVVDISTPASPVLTDFWNTPGSSSGIASDGNFGFVASGSLGFQTVDLASPNSLSVHGTAPGSGYTGLSVRGDTVYVTNSTGLQLLDISNPSIPTPISGGSLVVTGAGSVFLSGSYAFISQGSSGISIVDISNSSSPSLVGSAPALSGSLGRLTVKGDYAYIAGSTGLQVYDVSDPTSPFGMGFFDTDGGGMKDVLIRGDTAYVAQGAYFQPNSLTVLNISNPQIPVLKGKSSFGMTLSSLSIYGDYAYVGNYFPGMGVSAVNINELDADYLTDYGPCDPLNDGVGTISDVKAFGNFLYMTDKDGGLMVVDISDPDTLTHSDYIRSLDWDNSNPERIVLNGPYALVSDSTKGLLVIELY